MPRRGVSHERSARRAFTLIELIVVVILLAVVTGLVAPRLLDVSRRKADETARAVRNLVSIAAYRDAVGTQRVALAYSRTDRTLALQTLRSPDGGVGEGGPVQWLADPLVAPVLLEGMTLRSASMGGLALDVAQWRVEFPRHEPRGAIEIVMQAETGGTTSGLPRLFTVSLLPSASEATLDAGAGGVETPVDLDATGQGVSTW